MGKEISAKGICSFSVVVFN